MRILIGTTVFMIINLSFIYADYIQTDPITLTTDLQIEAQLVDINSLLTKNNVNADAMNIFKIVDDTPLFNYIHLENSKLFLSKPLNFNDLCNINDFSHCHHTLKIIAVNNNHFIEVPFQIKKKNIITTTQSPTITTVKLLEPLDFQMPSYSLEILDNLGIGHTIFKPALKNSKNNEHQIVFAFTEPITGFAIDELTGQISLKIPAWDLLKTNTSLLEQEQTFQMNIKATYKSLQSQNSSYFFYDYMLPAFAKLIVKVKHLVANVTVHDHLLNNRLLIKDAKKSKLLEIELNEPISAGQDLIGLSISSDQSLSTNRWSFDKNDKYFEVTYVNETYTLLRSKIIAEDLTTYSLRLRFEEVNRIGENLVTEYVVVLVVNFDPVVFTRPVYTLEITDSDIIDEQLIQVKVKPTFKSPTSEQVIRYALMPIGGLGFEINENTGWVSVKQKLPLTSYKLYVVAKNVNTQLSAKVEVSVSINCEMQRNGRKKFRFEVFENSPRHSRLGMLRPVCANSQLKYDILDLFLAKACTTGSSINCTEIYLNSTQINLRNYLAIDATSGQLITKNLLNASLFNPFFEKPINKLSLKFYVMGKAEFKKLNYQIDLQIQNAPVLLNQYPQLTLSVDPAMPSGLYNPDCIYTYKYLVDKSGQRSDGLVRFVSIDKNSGSHLKAEFKNMNQGCLSSFYIHNNGCLALKYADSCHEKDEVVLKAGTYRFEFKLCYYENSKVACSELIDQNIKVSDDVYSRSSRLIVDGQSQAEMTEEKELSSTSIFSGVTKLTGMKIGASIGTNMYFIVMISLLSVTVLVLVCILIKYKMCKGGIRNDFEEKKKNGSGFVTVQKANSKISVSNSETSGNSNLRSTNQTSDTDSNALTTSSKITKTDDENEEENVSKIRVSDDYMLEKIDKSNLSSKYVYTNANFSYAGSFSSLSSGSNSSTSCKTTSSEVLKNIKCLKINEAPYLHGNDDQGLYSVKNASIRFENSQLSNSKEITVSDSNQFNVEFYSSAKNVYYSNTNGLHVPSFIREKSPVSYNSNADGCLLKVTDGHENKINSTLVENFINSEKNNSTGNNNKDLDPKRQSDLITKKPTSIYESYYLTGSHKIGMIGPEDIIASIV